MKRNHNVGFFDGSNFQLYLADDEKLSEHYREEITNQAFKVSQVDDNLFYLRKDHVLVIILRQTINGQRNIKPYTISAVKDFSTVIISESSDKSLVLLLVHFINGNLRQIFVEGYANSENRIVVSKITEFNVTRFWAASKYCLIEHFHESELRLLIWQYYPDRRVDVKYMYEYLSHFKIANDILALWCYQEPVDHCGVDKLIIVSKTHLYLFQIKCEDQSLAVSNDNNGSDSLNHNDTFQLNPPFNMSLLNIFQGTIERVIPVQESNIIFIESEQGRSFRCTLTTGFIHVDEFVDYGQSVHINENLDHFSILAISTNNVGRVAI